MSPAIFEVDFDEFAEGGVEQRLVGGRHERGHVDEGVPVGGVFAGLFEGPNEFEQASVLAVGELTEVGVTIRRLFRGHGQPSSPREGRQNSGSRGTTTRVDSLRRVPWRLSKRGRFLRLTPQRSGL